MFAPTVTGSPLESACRVINRYETKGRGYYSGIVALIGRDATGRRELDSSILIRTAEIRGDGRLEIGVGATLVRHSDPRTEVAETKAKAAGLLAVLDGGPGGSQSTRVRAALAGVTRASPTSGWLTSSLAEPASGLVAASAGDRRGGHLHRDDSRHQLVVGAGSDNTPASISHTHSMASTWS